MIDRFVFILCSCNRTNPLPSLPIEAAFTFLSSVWGRYLRQFAVTTICTSICLDLSFSPSLSLYAIYKYTCNSWKPSLIVWITKLLEPPVGEARIYPACPLWQVGSHLWWCFRVGQRQGFLWHPWETMPTSKGRSSHQWASMHKCKWGKCLKRRVCQLLYRWHRGFRSDLPGRLQRYDRNNRGKAEFLRECHQSHEPHLGFIVEGGREKPGA